MKRPPIDWKSARWDRLDDSRLKFVLGIAEAGVEHEGWGKDPNVIAALAAMRAETKRRGLA
jgi:hypothetical protein